MLVSTLSVLILALVGFFWPRTLRWLSPNSWLSRWCRWALLPGSKEVENAAAYLNETHHYLVAQHKRLGDVFKQRRRGKTILFVRSARGVRDVLLSADFGKGDVIRQDTNQTQPFKLYGCMIEKSRATLTVSAYVRPFPKTTCLDRQSGNGPHTLTRTKAGSLPQKIAASA